MGAAEMQLSFFGLNIIMETILLCVISVVVGWRLSTFWNVMAFKKMLEDLGITQQQLEQLKSRLEAEGEIPTLESLVQDREPEQDLPILEVKVEQHPEGLFAYRKADSFFLARGQDREELMANLVNNLSNVRVVVAKEDGADLITPVA